MVLGIEPKLGAYKASTLSLLSLSQVDNSLILSDKQKLSGRGGVFTRLGAPAFALSDCKKINRNIKTSLTILFL